MEKRSFFLAVASVIAFCASAQMHNYEIKAGDFNRLRVLDNVNVEWHYNPDSIGYIRFYGADRFADAFIVDNNGKGTLKIQVNTDDIGDPELPTVMVYSEYLNSVYNSSDFTLKVFSPPGSSEFKAEMVGNGTIEVSGIKSTNVSAQINTGCGNIVLAGNCAAASFRMVGTGTIRADELRASTVKCSLMGTGAIYCWPIEELNASGIGSTKIYYRGTPEVMKKKGGGKLISLEE